MLDRATVTKVLNILKPDNYNDFFANLDQEEINATAQKVKTACEKILEIAKEKGLEPLADKLLQQKSIDIISLASQYINEEKGVETPEDALQGASDIIAEIIADDPAVRKRLRVVCMANGYLTSAAAKEAAQITGIKKGDKVFCFVGELGASNSPAELSAPPNWLRK